MMTLKISIHFLTYYSQDTNYPETHFCFKTTSSVITKYFCNVMFPSFSRFSQSHHFLIHPHRELEPGPLTYSKESLTSGETISELKLLQSRRLKKLLSVPKNQNAFSAQPPRCLHTLYLRLPRYCQYSLEIKVMSHLAFILL